MENMKLYQITNDLAELDRLMSQEVDGEAVEDREAILKVMNEALTSKGASVIKRIQSYEKMAKEAKEEAQRLTELSRYYAKEADKIKSYVVACMEGAGIPKIETPVGKMTTRKGAISLKVINEDKIPEVYKTREVVETVKVDKNQLKKDLKDVDLDGQKLLGVELVRGNTSLTIK